MSVLELKEITVERGGRPVVKDVTISVPSGEVTALLGPNGAGKSSLVLAVGGVLRPRAGSVSLDGAELTGKRPERIRAAGVAIVPEGRRLLPDLSVDDNLKVATYALSKQAAAEGRAARSSCSPGSATGSTSPPGRCPAANSRWWSSPRPSSRSRSTYSSTSCPWGWPRSSSTN